MIGALFTVGAVVTCLAAIVCYGMEKDDIALKLFIACCVFSYIGGFNS